MKNLQGSGDVRWRWGWGVGVIVACLGGCAALWGLQETVVEEESAPCDDSNDPDPCNGHGMCNTATGECICDSANMTPDCSDCADGYTGYPSCSVAAAARLYVESWFYPGESAGDRLSAEGSLSMGGDADGDGIGDVLAGAPAMDIFGYATGGAYLLSGSDGSLIQFFSGEAGNANFGYAVSLGGDASGDGLADVLVSAYTYDADAIMNSGKVYLFNGSTGEVIRTWQGDHPYQFLGRSVSLGADVDDDGLADVLVGDIGEQTTNKVFLYSSGTGDLLREFSGQEVGDRFGHTLELLDDVSGDGRGDVLIGARRTKVGNLERVGEVFLYSGLTGAVIHSWQGSQAGDEFGRTLSAGSDADGDGKVDVLIGAQIAERGGVLNRGEVKLFSSDDGGLLQTFNGSQDGDYFGGALALGGDLDGDSLGDVLIGSGTQRAAVYSSASGQLLHLWRSAEPSFGGAADMAGPGGAGLPSIVIGSPGYLDSGGALTHYVENSGPIDAECDGRCGGASDGVGGTCTSCDGAQICSEQVCIDDPCNPDPCNGHGTCNLGTCTCQEGFAGSECDSCDVGYTGYPACAATCVVAAPPADVSAVAGFDPDIVWNGSNYGISWHAIDGPYYINTGEISAAGAQIGGDHPINGEVGYETGIAWDGTRYGVTWSVDRDVGFACVNPDGTLFGNVLKLANGQSNVDDSVGVAYSLDDRFGVVWADVSNGNYSVYFTAIEPSSCTAITGAVQLSSSYAIGPNIANGSGSFGVVWQNGEGDMFFRRVNSSGNPLSPIVQVGDYNAVTDSSGGPQITYNQTEFAMVWGARSPDEQVVFARVDLNGVLQGKLITLADTSTGISGGALHPAIVPRGSNYGVAFRNGSEMGFMELDATGTRISPILGFNTGGYDIRIASDGIDYMMVSNNGTLQSIRVTCQ